MVEKHKATGKNRNTNPAIKAAVKAAVDAGEVVGERGAEAAAKALSKFDRDVFEKATSMAMEALSGASENQKAIESLNTQIEQKRYGIAHKLLILAQECVKLTTVNEVANLGNAAELMLEACSFAEDAALQRFAKDHNGAETTIGKLAGSWVAIKSEVVNSMSRAGIDPAKFTAPQPLRDAYKEWKAKNPDARDNRGTRSRTTDSPGTTASSATLPKNVQESAKVLNKLSDSARGTIARLLQVIQSLPAEQQLEASNMVEDTIKEIEAKFGSTDAEDDAAADKAAGVVEKGRRVNPARVPDSNQIAS